MISSKRPDGRERHSGGSILGHLITINLNQATTLAPVVGAFLSSISIRFQPSSSFLLSSTQQVLAHQAKLLDSKMTSSLSSASLSSNDALSESTYPPRPHAVRLSQLPFARDSWEHHNSGRRRLPIPPAEQSPRRQHGLSRSAPCSSRHTKGQHYLVDKDFSHIPIKVRRKPFHRNSSSPDTSFSSSSFSAQYATLKPLRASMSHVQPGRNSLDSAHPDSQPNPWDLVSNTNPNYADRHIAMFNRSLGASEGPAQANESRRRPLPCLPTHQAFNDAYHANFREPQEEHPFDVDHGGVQIGALIRPPPLLTISPATSRMSLDELSHQRPDSNSSLLIDNAHLLNVTPDLSSKSISDIDSDTSDSDYSQSHVSKPVLSVCERL